MNLATLCDSYICGAEIGTNCCHLAVFSFEREFSQHKVAPHHPLPYVSACGINYASEKVSNMLSNSAVTYPFNIWSIDILSITTELW